MSTEARDSFSGLVTNIAETKAPGSALRLADNVVVRKPGSIEPRQAYAPKVNPAGANTVVNCQTHAGVTVYSTPTSWLNSSGTALQMIEWPLQGLTTPAKFRADSFSTALSRGNHYVPFSTGVGRLVAPTSTSFGNAGIVPGCSSNSFLPSAASAGRGLPNGYQWAYRFVAKRTDANGLVVRSRPSGATFYKNTSGANAAVTITILGSGHSTGVDIPDSYEVYRTRAFPNAVQFDDEMALVGEVKNSGPLVFFDDVPDNLRGAALYTNPSQYGIENAHDRPPAAFCIETYRGHLFFGNTIGPQRYVINLNYTDRSGLATGVGWRNFVGDVTNGSNTVLNVTPTTGLQRGMVIGVTGSIYTVTNHITNISGSTVTLSENWLGATTVGAAGFFVDAISVGGTWIGIGQNTTGPLQFPFYVTAYSTPLRSRAVYEVTPSNYGFSNTFVIETYQRNSAAFALLATHGDEMVPKLDVYGGTTVSSTQDAYPNAIQWSRQDQPEHVPPANYALIAEKTKAVLGMASTRDSLFIFKEDGIWRLSGLGGQWSIDPFDLTTFCILPSSIRKLNNRIYLLTNKGVVTVGEQGVEQISFPIADVVKALVDDIRANYASLGYYKISGVDGVAATVDDRNSEYQLLLGTVAHELGAADMLVYNEMSGAWTTFSFQPSGTNGFTPAGLGIAEEGSPLILHASGGVKQAAYTTETTLSQTTRIKYDGAATSTTGVTSVDNGDDTADVTFGSAVTCVVGYDVLCTSAGDYPIIAVTDTTHVTVQLNGQAVPVFGATVRRGYPCTVQPHGFLNTIVMGKFWEDASVGFSRLLGPVSLSVDYSSAQPAVAESSQTISQPIELQRAQGIAPYHLGTLLGANVPTDHARSWLLRAKLIWLMVRGSVSLELVALSARDTAKNKPQLNSTGI